MQRKIMIVDDDKLLLEELQETLTLNGYNVITVDNPIEVIEKIKETRPIAILLDLKMPGKSGFQVATELKRVSETSGIPIIAMSGAYNDAAYSPLMRICGIQTCLKKPFTSEEVLKAIRVMLNLSNQ
jgi:two-component system, response regulator PdtaR